MLIAAVFVGGLMVLAVGGVIATRIASQNERNAFIKAENAELDKQIKEIATLKQEIEALKARQQAVEDLQSDRNQPVYLMDELVRQVPEGIYLSSFKQEGQKVMLNGYAQSQRAGLRTAAQPGQRLALAGAAGPGRNPGRHLGQGKDLRKVFEFTINVGIKRSP